MSTENLDRLLAAAKEFDGSDLHLVAGVPPAFRVNGEIIIADEDALIGQSRRAVRAVRDHHARHGVSVPAQLGLHMKLRAVGADRHVDRK